jgi:hypothetical protein
MVAVNLLVLDEYVTDADMISLGVTVGVPVRVPVVIDGVISTIAAG